MTPAEEPNRADRAEEEERIAELHGGERDPHHELNNPVGEPDPTEYPDPYERRDDPRDPPDPDAEPFGEEPHPPTGSTSTSEPHPAQDIAAPDAEPPERDKLDE